MTKQGIREQVREKRAALGSDWIEQASGQIRGHVSAMSDFATARSVGSYIALPREVQTAGLTDDAAKNGAAVWVPAFRSETGSYEFARWSGDMQLEVGPMRVPQPAEPKWLADEGMDLVLVPGMAFDPCGGRVGYGGGNYDRLLRVNAERANCAVHIGLAFDFQVFDRVPMDAHDVPVDLVVTQKGVSAVAGG